MDWNRINVRARARVPHHGSGEVLGDLALDEQAGVGRADLPLVEEDRAGGVLRSLVEVAYPDQLPAVLPNLRYLGVGPAPSQIVKDVPPTPELIQLA